MPLKALAATAPNSRDSSFCTSTDESYPYETLEESNIPHTPLQDNNNELTQSLPSCNSHVVPDMELPTAALEQKVQEILQQQHQHYQLVMQQQMLIQVTMHGKTSKYFRIQN